MTKEKQDMKKDNRSTAKNLLKYAGVCKELADLREDEPIAVTLTKELRAHKRALDRAIEEIYRCRGTIKSRKEIYNQLMKGDEDGIKRDK